MTSTSSMLSKNYAIKKILFLIKIIFNFRSKCCPFNLILRQLSFKYFKTYRLHFIINDEQKNYY